MALEGAVLAKFAPYFLTGSLREKQMATLVLTYICDDCDVERPTELCDDCNGTFCDDCMPEHECDPFTELDD